MKRKFFVSGLFAILLCLGGPLWAASSDYPTTMSPASTEKPLELELGYSYDALSNGYASWQEVYLSGLKQYGKGENIHGAVRNTNRFSLTDQEVSLGGATRLSKDWVLGLDASVSPSHRVLPQWTLDGELYHPLNKHWGVFFGLNHNQYNLSWVNIENVGLEYYWKKCRLAYTFRLSQLQNTSPNGTSHALQLDHYYTDRSKIGFVVSAGQDVENVGNNQVVLSDIRSFLITGIHWLDSSWGITYGAGVEDQHPFYTRTTGQLGLTHSF